MSRTRNNRIVDLESADGKFIRRITRTQAIRLRENCGARWVVPDKKLRLVGCRHRGSAAAVEARGHWQHFLALGKDPTENHALTFPELVQYIASGNPHRRIPSCKQHPADRRPSSRTERYRVVKFRKRLTPNSKTKFN